MMYWVSQCKCIVEIIERENNATKSAGLCLSKAKSSGTNVKQDSFNKYRQ